MSKEKAGVGKLMGAIHEKFPEPNLKSQKILKENGRIFHFWNADASEAPPHKTTILCSTPLATTGIFEMAPGRWGLPDKHKGCEIYYCIEGVCTVEDEGVCHDIHPGELFYIAPGTEHRVWNDTDKECVVLFTVSGGMEPPKGK